MENHQKFRIKTAMIVYALEEALGNYIAQNEELINEVSEGIRVDIVKREKERGNDIDKSDTTSLVEASYLNEIFSFALDISKETTYHKYILELKSFCTLLGIFEIRNAVSHPNRTFPDFFWYRSAAIASDPLIEKLNLASVKHALSSAVSENLNPPPDDWLNNVKWGIPNTLPSSFDHEITGLLGRDKDFNDLKSVLSKMRNNLIAVVAPGGIGKTALILQFLKDISLSPEWSNKIDAISFCTLKNERLTADGIEVIEAINGIDQIKDSILRDFTCLFPEKEFSSFENACERLENKKILICIDNLETLLIKSQSEFIEFNQSLPLLWRIIVTSRISIDSATTVPLVALAKRHAVSLCRNYFRKRGVSNISQEDVERIAEMANNNPLAIRLTIDLFIKEVDISKSIEKSQKDIALFSYRNLIESLKENSIMVIEAIYAIGDSTKTELIELLALTGEEIVESINELSKTSLIKRSTNEIGDDIFTLSDSIRDLLLITPKNIEIRSKITNDIKERKSKIREQARIDQQLGITEYDERYIEPGTDQSTHLLIVDLNQYFWRNGNNRQNLDVLNAIRNRFVDLLNHLPQSYQLHYHYSRILRFLKDKQGEISSLKKALKYGKEMPRILLSKALYSFYSGDYENAEIDFLSLIQKGLHRPQNSSPKFSYSINNCYLHSLLQLGKYDDVLEFTKSWKEDEDWMVLYGTHRATVLKRKTELRIGIDTNLSEETLANALNVFIIIFDKEGFHNTACPEAYKLVKQIQYSIKSQCQFSSEFLTTALNFVDKYFLNLASNLRSLGLSIDSDEVQGILKTFYDIELVDNPLKESKWYKPRTRLVYDREHIKELEAEGFTIVKVSSIPIGDEMPSYMFAKDKNDNQYYLNIDYFNGGWNRWAYIEVNTKLAIQYEKSKLRNKPSPARMIVEIDQYIE